MSEIQPQLAQIVEKLSRIPFDAIGRDVQSTIGEVKTAVGDVKTTIGKAGQAVSALTPEALGVLIELQTTLGKAQTSIDRLNRNLLDETAPVQRQTEQTLAEVQRAAQAMRVLADYLQRNPQSLIRGAQPDEPLSSGARSRPGTAGELPASTGRP